MGDGPSAGTALSLFAGVPEEELEEAFARLDARRLGAGSVLIAEGDQLHELYVIRKGSAEVFVADRQGGEHKVGEVSAGAILGEMSLLTGQPAVGTVRANEEIELLALTKDAFDRLGARFPQIYRNVGSMLAERLALTNRLTLGEEPGRLAVLVDHGAPALLGFAIAASVAWHTRRSTLLLVVGTDRPAELAAIAVDAALLTERRRRQETGVTVTLVESSGRFAPEKLAATVEELRSDYDNVLLQFRGGGGPSELRAHRTVELTAQGTSTRPLSGDYVVEAWAPPHEHVGPDERGAIRVPELEGADHDSLRRGLLPSSTAAGRKIGWVARDLAGLKVGIALGAGSVRGFAHFGVLRALGEEGVYPDCIAGTSAGAAAAALHALGHSPDEAAEIFLACGPALFRPTISTRSFLSNRGLRRFIRGVTGERRIEDLPLPFATVAADIETQREVVFRRGLVWQAVVASISIPGIYPALRIGEYTIVDGGVLNPVPVSVATQLGAGVVIGVKAGTKLLETDPDAEAVEEAGNPPSAILAILRSTELMQSRLAVDATDANALVLTPKLSGSETGGSLRTFKQGFRFVEDGYLAANEARHRIAALLPWLRP